MAVVLSGHRLLKENWPVCVKWRSLEKKAED